MVKQIARKKSFLMAFKATALSFLWYLFSIQLNKQYLQFKKMDMFWQFSIVVYKAKKR